MTYDFYLELIMANCDDMEKINDIIEKISFDDSISNKEYELLYNMAISYFR